MTNITNIQRYSIHDGEGIRTTVFFKGCPLACRWCHNPENIAFEPELMMYSDRCVGCGACAAACPVGCIAMADGRPSPDRRRCVACGACVTACPHEALELAGTRADIGSIVAACLKDLAFYDQSGGGVTLSGGEVMAQDPVFLAELTRRLKAEGLHVAIDTCGHAPWAHFEAVLPHADIFLYDIKHMDDSHHASFTGVGNRLILENLARLSAAGAAIHLRLPIIEGVNAGDEDIAAIVAWLGENGVRPVKISLLPYHSIGAGKLDRLGRPAGEDAFATPTPQRMEALAALLRAAGYGPVSIGG